jgi:uncharacterized membrane protein YfcA
VNIQAWQIVVIFCAAYIAGVMNALAGGGTILTFPALIWIGLDPVVANITSTIALLPGALSSFFGYRKEVSGSRKWIKLFLLPSFIGGLLGALLLLLTPANFFAAIVPFLILFATVLFALQEPITRKLRGSSGSAKNLAVTVASVNTVDTVNQHDKWLQSQINDEQVLEPQSNAGIGKTLQLYNVSQKWLIGAVLMQFLVAIYGGYFGAGVGILMLATLGLLGLTDIHQMNGLKNLLGFSINSIAAASFIVSGNVKWSAAIIMAIAAIIGGYSGAHLARRLGRTFARRAVIVIGLIMTISLFFNH